MRAGDALISTGKDRKVDRHIWFVISDPAADRDHVVMVNFTSQRADKDQSCVVVPGEHPFVKHETVVYYAGARVVKEADLLALKSAGYLKFDSQLSKELLERVREGAWKSDDMPLGARQILLDQGLIS